MLNKIWQDFLSNKDRSNNETLCFLYEPHVSKTIIFNSFK